MKKICLDSQCIFEIHLFLSWKEVKPFNTFQRKWFPESNWTTIFTQEKERDTKRKIERKKKKPTHLRSLEILSHLRIQALEALPPFWLWFTPQSQDWNTLWPHFRGWLRMWGSQLLQLLHGSPEGWGGKVGTLEHFCALSSREKGGKVTLGLSQSPREVRSHGWWAKQLPEVEEINHSIYNSQGLSTTAPFI